jgi:hypothetical protein
MRKSLLILGVIVVVIAVAVGFVLANLNAYLNSNKDWLAAQVEGVLGRKVSFSEIGVSLSSGFVARIKDVRIADDPAFSQDDFVRAGAVEVSVKFWPALFRRFEVKRLVLEKPDVTILRTRDGMNYDSIGKTKNAEAPPVSEAPKAPPSEAAPAALMVALVDIKGGRVHFVDMTTSPQTDFSVSALDGSAQRERNSPVRLHGAVRCSAPTNVRLRWHRRSRRDDAGYADDPRRGVAAGQSVGSRRAEEAAGARPGAPAGACVFRSGHAGGEGERHGCAARHRGHCRCDQRVARLRHDVHEAEERAAPPRARGVAHAHDD